MTESRAAFRAVLLREKEIHNALKRIAYQIVEYHHGTNDLVLLGIRRRGVPLAQKIAQAIVMHEGAYVPVGELDITYYRDDQERITPDPVLNQEFVGVDVTGKSVVLVDDVLYTGRTIRAAMDAVMDIGRPASITLAVLIDRGHRELPIKANFVGKNVPTSEMEFVSVQVQEVDGISRVVLYEKK